MPIAVEHDRMLEDLMMQRIGVSQQNADTAANKVATTSADKGTALIARLKKNTIEFHQKQIDEIAKEVQGGILTPKQGTQMIKQGVAKWDDWEKQENPMFEQYSAPDFSLSVKGVETGSETETTTDPKDPNKKHTVFQKTFGTPGTMTARPPLAPGLPNFTQTPTNAPTASAGPVTPKSQDEFDALPSGALYINPADGKQFRKK